MDFDAAWCPSCERLIPPKRYVSVMPPAPPPSPSRKVPQGGIVNGTGRNIKHPRPQMKQHLIIDNGPIPLYCSDACHIADGKARRNNAPQNPASEETASSSSSSNSSSSIVTLPQNDKPLSPRERFAKAYGITLPPVPPQCTTNLDDGHPPLDYTGGNMMAGKFIDSMCKANKSSNGKVIPGWNDGSMAWRSAVYSYTPQSPSDPFFKHLHPSSASASSDPQFRRSPSSSSSSAPAAPCPLENDELIAKFNNTFTTRCEARLAQSSSHSRSSTPASQPIKRERSILQPGAEGKLLVPDVKLKVRTGSSTSVSSANPTCRSRSSKKSARSPLSQTGGSDFQEEITTSFTLKRPTIESMFFISLFRISCHRHIIS